MNKELYPQFPILIVDDEEHFLDSMKVTLNSNGITHVEVCKDCLEVLPRLKEKEFSLILLDIMMPVIRGDELLPKILEEYPEIPIVMLTAVEDSAKMIECMKRGAMDYLLKAADTLQWINTIRKVLSIASIKKENVLLKKSMQSENPNNPKYFNHIITQDKKMLYIFKLIEVIARSEDPVLITGETGVGKELIARAIHNASEKQGKFVAVNVAGLDDTIFSDTIFGHKKGGFTDAHQDRDGLITKAQYGTLLLDEIGDLSEQSQIKLLRLLQEKEFFPIGDDKSKECNARIIVATNRNLDELMEKGKFRKDLYGRIEYHQIYIPPLKERPGDIPRLVDYFVKKAATEQDKEIIHVPEILFTLLSKYDFPRNVRELETMITGAVTRSKDGILSMDLIYEKIGKFPEPPKPGVILEKPFEKPVDTNFGKEQGVIFHGPFPNYKQMKKIYLEEALKRVGGNQSEAAKNAGLARTTFLNKLKKVK